VVQAQGDSIQVRTPDQGLLDLQVTDATAVKLNGQTAPLSQIKPGSDVRASYQEVDGKAKALTIDATSSKASGQ
jgi:cell envelope opacity-associated protein A